MENCPMKKCRFPSLLAAVILLAALFLPMSAAAVEDPGLTCRNGKIRPKPESAESENR